MQFFRGSEVFFVGWILPNFLKINPTNMDRRVFLGFPLVAAALTRSATVAKAQGSQPSRPKKGIRVGHGKDRFQDELLMMGGQFDCKVSGKDTNGQLCIYDTYREQKGGPGLHLHHEQDEWFYVVKGEFIIKVGDDQLNLKAGDCAFAPRKVPHAFANVTDGPAQMLVLFQPAGSIEEFFKEMSKLGRSIPKDWQKDLAELMRKHGMELVGPPLKV
jgi:mannose-6-phosphate isomerase-like protein (cupin superfamily)